MEIWAELRHPCAAHEIDVVCPALSVPRRRRASQRHRRRRRAPDESRRFRREQGHGKNGRSDDRLAASAAVQTTKGRVDDPIFLASLKSLLYL